MPTTNACGAAARVRQNENAREARLPTLYLLRHLNSAPAAGEMEDHDRPLSSRGRQDGRALAVHLRRNGISPALVLCSSALRARETLDLLMPGFAAPPLTAIDRDLYLAGATGLLRHLRQIEDGIASAMLIGHNPGLHELALRLAGEDSEPRRRLAGHFPTGALAIYEIAGGWRDLGSARLAAYAVPAELG
jgi:phosphohistidine phosphatase